jgi:ACS family hexuronate transporter-like MFS transporter
MNSAEARELAASGGAASRYPWIVVGLLWVVAFLNSADRTIVIAVMPQLRTEFGLSQTQLALISSAFFWIYAVAAFLSGRLGDRAPRSRVILYGLVFWSVATGVASLSTGFGMLIALRGVVALGESTYFPAATALISDWHTPQMRSRTLSLHQTGVFAGAGLGALSSGMIADRFGWRVPYLLYGAVGLVVCLVLKKWLRDAPPRRHGPGTPVAPNRAAVDAARRPPNAAGELNVTPGANAAGELNVTPGANAAREPNVRPGPNTAREPNAVRGPLTIVLGTPPALFLCVVFFLATGASTGLTVWAPTYVHDALGLNLGASALYGSATINVAGFLAVPLGGLLADGLTARTTIGRFYALIIGLSLAAPCLLPLTLAGSALTVGLVLLASSIGKGLFDGCIYAAMHDVVPPEARATAVGLMTMLGFFGAGITPIFVAKAAEHYGMAAGISSLTVLYFIAVALLLATRGVTRHAVLETRQLETGY